MTKKKIIIISVAIALALIIGVVALIYISKNSFSVTYELNGGEMDEDKTTVWYNKYYELPFPVRDGYTFSGWYCDGEYFESAGVWEFKEDKKLTAQWKIKDKNGIVYRKTDTGYTVEAYEGVANSVIVMPLNYNGAVIDSIGDGAFAALEAHASGSNPILIYIPSTVENVPVVSNNIHLLKYNHIADNKLIYLEKEDSTELVGYQGDYREDVVIPITMKKKIVNKIGPYTFYNGVKKIDHSSASFFRVMMSENISYIGENAFGNCGGMKLSVYYLNDNNEVREKIDASELYDWLTETEICQGNEQFADVVTQIRPAFGWSIYSNAHIYVRLDANGGVVKNGDKVISDMEIKYRGEYSLPIPTKEGYTFDDWYYEETAVPIEGEKWKYSKHLTLVAHWIENK